MTSFHLRRDSLMRSLARLCYSIVRPVARPIMWRVRTFMLEDATSELRATRDRLENLERHLGEVLEDRFENLERHLESLGKALAEKEWTNAAAVEMRELAAQINRVVLTLALSNPRGLGSDFETDAMTARQADADPVSKSRTSHNPSA
jgi:hypothetical protein